MNSPNELFEVTYTYWLMTLFMSVGVTVGYVVRLLLGKSERFLVWNRATAVTAALTLCLVAVAGMNLAHGNLGSSYRLIGIVAVVVTTMLVARLHLNHSRTPWEQFRRCYSAWFLLASSVGLVFWSSYQYQERLTPPAKRMLLIALPPGKKVQQILEFVAFTDGNHPIKVFRLDQAATDSVDNVLREPDFSVEYNGTMIQRAQGDLLANCHGWVFLDGQYLITGEAVQRILDDNGYEVVDEPTAGDVIIYRDQHRNIVHSGLVRGVLNDGTVIIESKWGVEGVFLHNPLDTPYSVLFDYYRSPRPTHQVKIVPVDELSSDR